MTERARTAVQVGLAFGVFQLGSLLLQATGLSAVHESVPGALFALAISVGLGALGGFLYAVLRERWPAARWTARARAGLLAGAGAMLPLSIAGLIRLRAEGALAFGLAALVLAAGAVLGSMLAVVGGPLLARAGWGSPPRRPG